MKGEGQKKKKHHYGDLIKKQFQQKYLVQVIFNIKTISTEIWEEITPAINGVRWTYEVLKGLENSLEV